MVQTISQTKVLMNNVKRQFVDDITIQLNKIENSKSQFKKVVESTKCNNVSSKSKIIIVAIIIIITICFICFYYIKTYL